MRKALLALLLLSLTHVVWGEDTDELFRSDRPESYTAKEGDTLWGIAGHFLVDPWSWREVWSVHPDIENSDIIYPGDVVSVALVEGKLRLTLARAKGNEPIPDRIIKLTPKVRSTPLVDAIPAIPLDAIHSFLGMSRIIDGESMLQRAPRILSNSREQVVSGSGDTVFARGDFNQGERVYGVFRKGKAYQDPRTGEYLGTMMLNVGSMNLKSVNDDVATMYVTKAGKEIRTGDRLLVSEERRLATSFTPGSPESKSIEGEILDVVGGVRNIGLYNNVVINLGTRDTVEDGDVLAIYRGHSTRDHVTGETLGLPLHRVGLVMVFRSYEKISFAVVMEATEPLQTGDILRVP